MEISTILSAGSEISGYGALFVVLWMISTGRLVSGSVHTEMREDRDFYRDRFKESANLLGNLLASVELDTSEDDESNGT